MVTLCTTADNHGGDYFNVNVSVTNPKTGRSITTAYLPTTNRWDWENFDIDISSLNLLLKSRLDLKLIVQIKNE